MGVPPGYEPLRDEEPRRKGSPLANLPQEVFDKITKELSAKELGRLSTQSRGLHQLVGHSKNWLNHLADQQIVISDSPSGRNLHRVYLERVVRRLDARKTFEARRHLLKILVRPLRLCALAATHGFFGLSLLLMISSQLGVSSIMMVVILAHEAFVRPVLGGIWQAFAPERVPRWIDEAFDLDQLIDRGLNAPLQWLGGRWDGVLNRLSSRWEMNLADRLARTMFKDLVRVMSA